jgi:uncharacterized repeat protein (TIGR01451 family)
MKRKDASMAHHIRIQAMALAPWLSRGVCAASAASLLFASSCASMPSFASRKSKKDAALASRPDAQPLKDAATGNAIPSYAERLEAAKKAQTTPPTAGEPKVEHAVVGEQHLVAKVDQISHEQPAVEPKPTATTDRPWAPDLNGFPTVAPLNDAAIVAQMCPPGGSVPSYCPPCESSALPVVTAGAQPRPFPTEKGRDEYVCDGGDKGRPFHYEAGAPAGLEAEDTVAEFRDRAGNKKVTVSNEVCVYAPRFGVARAVSEAVERFTVNAPSGAHDGVQVAGYSHRAVLDEKKDVGTPVTGRVNDRLSQVQNRQADGELENDMIVASHVKLINPFEDYGFIRDGVYRSAEKSVLFEAANAANEWSVDRGTQAVAVDRAGAEVLAEFNVMELVGTKDMRTPGDLRIVKLADRKTAKIGDVVTFTIRFDNQGGQELYEIRILDNLSPRLALIDDSVTCDVAGELEIADSGTGSEVLTFRMNDSLPGHTGGTLTFQCKVR